MTIPTDSDRAPKQDIFSRARFRYTQIMTAFTILGEIIGLFVILAAEGLEPSSRLIGLGLVVGFMVIDGFLLYLLSHGQGIELAIVVLNLKLVVGALVASALAPYWWFMMAAALSVLTAATLAPEWLYVLVNVVILGQTGYTIMSHTFEANVIASDASPGVVLIMTLIALSVTTRYFTNTSRRATEAANQSAWLLRGAAETGQDLAKMLNLDDMLARAVDLIRDRFGFYHVQVFLIDEQGINARLVASTGTVGQKLFERQHSLPVGSRSVIGTVTSTGKLVIARDTDPYYYRNELLSSTRSELALPIFDGDKIIGALDVQSRRYDVFGNEIVQALQTLANQLGTTIRNSRLFEAQEHATSDTKRMFLEAETNLREIQRLNQQLTRQGWQNYLGNRQSSSSITVDKEQITSRGEWSEALIEAAHTRQPVRESHDGLPVIAVPLMLGNEVIGAIEVESAGQKTDAETVEMVQAVAQRLAISLDKARLFEESQEATAREQRINEIVGRYQTVTNVDELLRITLEELSQTLGAKRSAIRLGAVPGASGNGDSPA